MAVKITNLLELAVHRLGYEKRHFVLCQKDLGTIYGFEVEETYFPFFNIKTLFSFAAWRSQGQLNIPSLEKPYIYKRLRKLGGKISLPVGKYKITLPVCCLCSLPEKELNVNYSNENLDVEK